MKAQGYVVFLPRRWETCSKNGRATTALIPIFTGYLFVALDREERQSVRAINSTEGVQRVVTLGNEPATIHEADMWAMRRYFDPDGVEPPGGRSRKHLRRIVREKIAPLMTELTIDDILARIEALDDTGMHRIQGHASATHSPDAR